MNVLTLKNTAVFAFGRTVVTVKKYSPEIMLVLGLSGGVVAGVMASKASTKAEVLLDRNKEIINKVHDAREKYPETTYSKEDYKQDLVISYVNMAKDFIKLYGPSVTLAILSILLILGSHGIMSKRNAALMAAYKLVDESYSKYRDRVAKEFGEEKEKLLRYNLVDEANKPKKKKKKGEEIAVLDNEELKKSVEDALEVSPYARWFDENTVEWKRDNFLNMAFLQTQQTYANQLLQGRGHVFLNEIYDALGLPRSKEGAIVGWVRDHGDNVINFNMYSPTIEENVDFVNGYQSKRILLDFNVDGVIFDMI